MQDPIADMLTRIRNAQQAKKVVVTMPHSQMKARICHVLQEEGFIGDYLKTGEEKKPLLKIHLKYYEGSPVINRIRRISRPGLRIYKKVNSFPSVPGFGSSVISTSKGVVSGRVARQLGVGGELICEVA